MLEAVVALALIAVLLSILLPALSSARVTSHRAQCAGHLRELGEGWQAYLADHNKQFPFVAVQPGWRYGGVRVSRVSASAFPDFDRPLTPYLHLHRTRVFDELCVCCPADRGISGAASGAGTGERTVFESFGTSYRANAPLMDARLAGITQEMRGMRRSEITTSPSRLLLAGDPVWYEVAESTGRTADWHNQEGAGNMLFLDGSVQFKRALPRERSGPIVLDPIAQGHRLLMPGGESATTSPAPAAATQPGATTSPQPLQ
jgi:prepilin-type processing-associated H-X9-DG protein